MKTLFNARNAKEKPKKEPKPTKPKKPDNINNEKAMKPKRNLGKRIARVILWGVLGFFFLLGVLDVARPNPLAEMRQRVDGFMAEQRAEQNLTFELESFAQNFAREYLTYEAGRLDDYLWRVAPYVSSYVSFADLQSLGHTATASYLQAYKIEPYDDTQYDVYINAVVDYLQPQPAGDGEEAVANTQRAGSCLKVPVRVLGQGQYIVVDYPVFVAPPGGYEYQYSQFAGSEVERDIQDEIAQVLENFFAAYYEENQTRIDYYLSPDADRGDFQGLGGRYRFVKLSSLRAFADPMDTGSILALVELTIEDRNGQELTQRFNILLQQSGDRYHVVAIETKTVGLKYNFTEQ